MYFLFFFFSKNTTAPINIFYFILNVLNKASSSFLFAFMLYQHQIYTKPTQNIVTITVIITGLCSISDILTSINYYSGISLLYKKAYCSFYRITRVLILKFLLLSKFQHQCSYKMVLIYKKCRLIPIM